MTLAIATLTSSGIVLTADSRQTYKNQAGAIRVGSSSATKLFRLNNVCGVAISGRAFLNEDKQPIKDAGFFIRRFAESEKLDGLKTKEIAEKLGKFLGDIFVNRELDAMKKQIEQLVKDRGGSDLKIGSDGNLLPYTYKAKDGKTASDTGWIETIHMIVAGIDDDKVGRAYSFLIPKGVVAERDTQNCGAVWVGQTDVLTRVVLGYAPEIANLKFVKDAIAADSAAVQAEFQKLEYIINWGTITLQDAIDFCVLMTRTTESIQRFSDGTVLSPGGIPGVGGDIDIAIMTPANGFIWLKQKTLQAEGLELAMDSIPLPSAKTPVD